MKISELFSTENLKNNLIRISYRFPLSLILVCGITGVFFLLLRGDFSQEIEGYLVRIIFSLIITFFLSIGIYLGSEFFQYKKINRGFFQLFAILFGFFFYSTFSPNMNDFNNFIYFVLTGVGIISFIFFAPYLSKIVTQTEIQKSYYNYFYSLSGVFFMSFILGGVLFALGAIGITTVFTLFDIRSIISEKIYGDWAIISLSCITPIFALIKIPQKETFNSIECKQNIFFSFLVKYIATPFIYIYFFILYTYSIKVLLNFHEWPKGEVSWMVIGFSIFGYLIYMFSTYFEEENKFIRFFRKCFPFVVIPQLFMLFYAIYLRIAQYDITINRYFVVIFGCWLGVISLYLIFSKQKQIIYIPAILTLFSFIISIGPWGVYSLPESRQLARLNNNLKNAGILEDGKIVPLKTYEDIDQNLSKEIYNGINYLCEFDDCKTIKNIFGSIYFHYEVEHKKEFEEMLKKDKEINSTFKREYSPPSRWEIVEEITKQIKVQEYDSFYNEELQENIYLYQDEKFIYSPIDISGYSKLYKISADYTRNINENIFSFELNISNDSIDTIDLKPVIESLTQSYKQNKRKDLTEQNMTYEVTGKKGIYKIIIESISIQNPFFTGTPSGYNYNNIGGYILEK